MVRDYLLIDKDFTEWKHRQKTMFPETHWTLIANATLNGDGEGRKALTRLCERYYVPVRKFILWTGRSDAEADDLTQAFFLHLCEKGIVHQADRLRGRFRSFVISVLKHFLSHHDRRAAAVKRGGEIEIIPLEPEIHDAEAAGEDRAQFDRQWAITLMERSLAAVFAELAQARGDAPAEILKQFLSMQQAAPTYEAAAAKLGITEGAMKMEVLRWRRRLGEQVRREIAITVSSPHEIEEELQYLRELLLS